MTSWYPAAPAGAEQSQKAVATLAEARTTTRRRGRLLIALAALPAIAGAVLLGARTFRTSPTPTGGQARVSEPAPPAVFARQICSFSNADAAAAYVQGADGGQSLVVGGRTWWLFGDTLFLPASGKQIEQNAIAWSDARADDGCPKLTYYTRDGIAVPFLPKDGSLTVWPSGAWAVDDHTFDFYTSYIYGSGPYAYSIGEIGLAQLDTTTMQTTVLSRKLWGADGTTTEQIIGTEPVEVGSDGLLRIVIQTKASGVTESTGVREILARVEPSRIADAAAYEYWTGGRWSASLADARPLWQVPGSDDPVRKLADFENGASIAWNKSLHKYVALVNTSFASVGARTADRLEGQWSDAQPWLDCTTFAQVRVPTCYSPLQHASLATDDGGSMFVTASSIEPYSTTAFEVRPAVAIHEWRGAHDAVAYAASSPASGSSDQGVAFYAATTAIAGFEPIYHWQHGDVSRFAAASPGDGFTRGDAAFFAAPAASVAGSLVAYRPVFVWRNGDAELLSPKISGLEQYGYTRGEAAFFAP